MEFEALAPILVKGKEQEVAVFRPVRDGRQEREREALLLATVAAGKGRREHLASGVSSLGALAVRTGERDRLLRILARLYGGGGGVLMLGGEAGSGKTELAKIVTKESERFEHLSRPDPQRSSITSLYPTPRHCLDRKSSCAGTSPG